MRFKSLLVTNLVEDSTAIRFDFFKCGHTKKNKIKNPNSIKSIYDDE